MAPTENGQEWRCVEFDVDEPIPPTPDLPPPPTICELFEEVAENFGGYFKTIFKQCCSIPSGDSDPECCRCNKQKIDDPSTRFFGFKRLNAKGECPSFFSGEDFAFPADLVPEAVRQNMKKLLDEEP